MVENIIQGFLPVQHWLIYTNSQTSVKYAIYNNYSYDQYYKYLDKISHPFKNNERKNIHTASQQTSDILIYREVVFNYVYVQFGLKGKHGRLKFIGPE